MSEFKHKRIPLKKMTHLELTTGFEEDENVILEVAPTMRNFTYKGKKYFRMSDVRCYHDDGTQTVLYLWDGWMKENYRRKTEGAKP